MSFGCRKLKCLNKKPRDYCGHEPQFKSQAQNVHKRGQEHAKRKLTFVAAVIAAIIVVAAVAFVLLYQPRFQNNVNPSPTPTATPTPSPTPTPYYDSSAAPLTSPAGEYSANGTRILFIVSGTDSSGNAFTGNITIQMRDDKPITTQNFINLVKQGFYSGTIFHRVIAGFMIQGGQNQTTNVASINDEIGNDNHNNIGTIAMAKTSSPNSATSEFFINVANNGNNPIDQKGTLFDTVYAVFGQVIGGMDIVNKIANVQVQPNAQMGGETPASLPSDGSHGSSPELNLLFFCPARLPFGGLVVN